MTFVIIENWSYSSNGVADDCLRSIVSTRIPIKVPASRSYTRTPFVKSVDAHVYTHIHSYTHTSTPTNGFCTSLGARQDMPQGWKREKERYFVRGITFVNRKGDYAGYAGGHYKRCLWFVSKYNVPAAIFAMRTNGRYFHFLWSLSQSHGLPRKNSLSTRIILSIRCSINLLWFY